MNDLHRVRQEIKADNPPVLLLNIALIFSGLFFLYNIIDFDHWHMDLEMPEMLFALVIALLLVFARKLVEESTSVLLVDSALAISALFLLDYTIDLEDFELDLEMPEALFPFVLVILLVLAHRFLAKSFPSAGLIALFRQQGPASAHTAKSVQPVAVHPAAPKPAHHASAPHKAAGPSDPDLHGFIKNMPQGICQYSASQDHTINYQSESFEHMLGWNKRAPIKPVNFISLVVEEDRAQLEQSIIQVALEGGQKSSSYRMKRSDGSVIWVSDCIKATKDTNGKVWIYAVIMDVTDRLEFYDDLKWNVERSNILYSQLNDIIFEIDVEKDTMTYSMNWESKLASAAPTERVLNEIVAREIVHPDDSENLLAMFRRCLQNGEASEVQVRLRGKTQKYIWCIVRICSVKGSSGKVEKLLGIITDCDMERQEIERLREKAEKDELTGLFNKYTVQEKIKTHLCSRLQSERCALFMIDMDNFKHINDTYGHHIGDYVLRQTGAALRNACEGLHAYAGRMGGDEFIVFAYDIQYDSDFVSFFQNKLKQSLQIHVPDSQEVFTGSVGGAMAQPDETFEQLYIRSDKALYRDKQTKPGIAS